MKNVKNTLLTLIIAISSTFGLATHEPAKNEPPVITIFVHGSKPWMIPDAFYKIGHYFFQPGLQHVDAQDKQGGPRGIIKGLKDSGYVDSKHLYFFGWSGELDAQKRLEDARILKEEIEKVIQKYVEEYGVTPKLHIITHSHGGNVALNLAHELEAKKSAITLDEIILLGTPADQAWTKEYIGSKNIGKTYHFYSENDWIQVADPQGLQVRLNNNEVNNKVINKPKFFERSKRTFDHHENLTQIQTIINEKSPWHITFIDYYPPKFKDWVKHLVKDSQHQFPRFLPELGDIMRKVKDEEVQSHIKQNKKPVTVKIDTHKARDNGRVKIDLKGQS